MKKKAALIILTLCAYNSTHAIPKLDRLRKKVEEQETFSLKDILKQADTQNLNGQPITILGPTKDNPFGSVVSAREPSEFEIAIMLSDIKKQLKKMLWASDTELITSLNNLIVQNKPQEARQLLANKIVEKHGQDKVPLFAFTNKLQEEEKALVDFTTQFFSLLSKNSSNKDQLNTLLAQAQELRSNLTQIINNVTKLLLE